MLLALLRCYDTYVCSGLCYASYYHSCKGRLSDWKQIWGTRGVGPNSLDLMTHFLSCLMPQAVKRQSRCPEVPHHRTRGSTEYTSCRDRVSNWERHTLATRQQIKAHFPSRKLTTIHRGLESDVQHIPEVILWSSAENHFSWWSQRKKLQFMHPP